MKHKPLEFPILFLVLFLSWAQAVASDDVDTTKHDPAEYLSNTLPVLYINTIDEQPIVDKEHYIDGYYYVDANGFEEYESIGSVDAPLPLKIKGRGNATWTLPKKPYRLKLDSKASLLGMPKSKHWILLTSYGDWLAGHGRNYLCFKISVKLGMPYTPRNVPCEVVLNGDYIGMYFLTEQIRVAKDRVNITEQDDGETNPSLITGGWLLELDNYNDDCQIRFTDKGTGRMMRVTYHSPEELSEEQYNYLANIIFSVNELVNTKDYTSREWEQYIDIDALARFYMMLEAIDDQEGFSGSCWFSKERGEDTKLVWGPFWDSGSALGGRNQTAPDFFYNDKDSTRRNCWIRNIVKFPRFQIAYRKWWEKYRDEVFPTMQEEVDAYGQLTEQALAADYARWGDKSATNPAYYRRKFMNALGNRVNFLSSQWDVHPDGVKWSTYISDEDLALPEGLKAYTVNMVNNGKAFLTEISYIPSGVGVMLCGETNIDSVAHVPYTGETIEYTSMLVGNSDTLMINDGYVLHNDVLVLVPGETKVPEHHCYLPFSSNQDSPTIMDIAYKGDVNGDGKISSNDITVLYDYLLNNDLSNLVNADVNGDGNITSVDVTIVYNILLGE